MSAIETVIIKSLFKSKEYVANIFPFLKSEYFTDVSAKIAFEQVQSYIETYHNNPTFEAICIQMDSDKSINEAQQSGVIELLESVASDTEETQYEWLYNESEKFCKNAAIYNAITQAIGIAEGKDKLSPDAIPNLLQDALAVSFNTNVGHDYFEDADARFEEYHSKIDKVPFKSKTLNHITNGGQPRKSLRCYLSPSGVGKSMQMCSDAADYIEDGYNVAYFTMEMSERKIAERIDANLLDIDITNLFSINRNDFNSKIDKLKSKTRGKLIIKEFPTGVGSAALFRQILMEAKHKKGFVPDVIIVDYLGICASSRIKLGASINSYTVLKAVAEEIRALCQEMNAVGVTAAQTNKSGYNNSDIDVTSTADSMGILHTLDLYLAITVDEGMEESGELMFTQLKNRYGSIAFRRFRMKMERSRMRVSDHPNTLTTINDFKSKIGAAPIEITTVPDDVGINMVKFGAKKSINTDNGVNYD